MLSQEIVYLRCVIVCCPSIGICSSERLLKGLQAEHISLTFFVVQMENNDERSEGRMLTVFCTVNGLAKLQISLQDEAPTGT